MTATETSYYATVVDAARMFGWTVAHFRPAHTQRGWRTAVQGDGAGFPDFVLVHPDAGRVWFRELKTDGARPSPEQRRWATDLVAAGANYELINVPSGADRFVTQLADIRKGSPMLRPIPCPYCGRALTEGERSMRGWCDRCRSEQLDRLR